MVLYESHLGGWFVTDEPLSWEETYCEECGDSDQMVGTFEDARELWELAKPARVACVGCAKEPWCVEDCADVDADGTDWALDEVMRTVGEYAEPGEGSTVVLAARDAKSGGFYAYFKKGKKREFGEILSLPSCFCLTPELEAKVALSIAPFAADVEGLPKKVAQARAGERTIVVCLAETREPSEDEDPQEAGAALFDRDGWVAVATLEDLVEKGDAATAAAAKTLAEKIGEKAEER